MCERLGDAVCMGVVEEAARVAVETKNSMLMEKCVGTLPTGVTEYEEWWYTDELEEEEKVKKLKDMYEGNVHAVVSVVDALAQSDYAPAGKILGGAIDSVRWAIFTHQIDDNVQELCFRALGKIAGKSIENRQRILAEEDGLKSTLCWLTQVLHKTSRFDFTPEGDPILEEARTKFAQLHLTCLETLHIVLDVPPAKSGFSKWCGASPWRDVVPSAMRLHFGNVGVQVAGCKVISLLILDRDHNGEDIQGGGLTAVEFGPHARFLGAISGALKTFATMGTDAWQQGIATMLHVIGATMDDIEHADGDCAITVVTKVMRARESSARVQVYGCQALTELMRCYVHRERDPAIAVLNYTRAGETGAIEFLLDTIKEYPKTTPITSERESQCILTSRIQMHWCHALGSLIARQSFTVCQWSPEVNVRRASKHGGMEIIMDVILAHLRCEVAETENDQNERDRRSHRDHNLILASLFNVMIALLHEMDLSGDILRRARKEGFIETVVESIKSFSNSRSYKEDPMQIMFGGLFVLPLLVSDAEIACRAGKAGLAEAVVEILCQWQWERAFRWEEFACCLELLNNLEIHFSSFLPKIKETGVIKAVVSNLSEMVESDRARDLRRDGKAMTQGLIALRSFVEHDAENDRAFGEAGGIGFVVEAMKYYADDWEIQALGSSILATVASPKVAAIDAPQHQQFDDYTNRRGIYKAGGVEVLVKAIERHGNVTNVVGEASKVLGHLGEDYYFEQLEEDCEEERRVRECGGIEAVIEVMKAHPEDVDLQWVCCHSLKVLLVHEDRENQNRARGSGGIEAVVEVIKAHGGDTNEPGMTAIGCSTLRSLVYRNDLSRVLAGEAGGVEAVVGALKVCRQRDCEDEDELEGQALIAEIGCSTLQNLVHGNVENRDRLGEAGIEAIREQAGEEGLVLEETWDDRISWTFWSD
jgi:hypothetical protein